VPVLAKSARATPAAAVLAAATIFTFVGGGRESYERIELTRVTDHG
jgi:hypothetical protein